MAISQNLSRADQASECSYRKAQQVSNPPIKKTSDMPNLNNLSLILTFAINLVGSHGLEAEHSVCFTGIQSFITPIK